MYIIDKTPLAAGMSIKQVMLESPTLKASLSVMSAANASSAVLKPRDDTSVALVAVVALVAGFADARSSG